MLKLRFVAIMVSVLCVSAVSADTTVKPYGFGSVSVPTSKDGEYILRWVRVGANINPHKWMRVHVEYDVATSKVSYGYAEVAGSVAGVRTAIVVGQMLSTVGYLYPGPATLELTRWPDTLSAYALRNTGVAISASGKGGVIRISHYASNQLSATATYKRASLFYQRGIGGGAITQPILIHRYIQPSAGVSVQKKEVVAFAQNRVKLTPWLNAYFQTDYHSSDKAVKPLVGLAAVYAPRAFVKLFWDGKEEKFKTELTFAF